MRFIDFKLFRFWYSSIYYEAYQTVSWWNNLDYLDIVIRAKEYLSTFFMSLH